jgi:hypothetical protein
MTSEVGAIFELYVDDDRYEVPTLRFSVASDEAEACALAVRLLEESPHHRGVEVRRGDRRVCAVGAFADPPLARVRLDLVRPLRRAGGRAG